MDAVDFALERQSQHLAESGRKLQDYGLPEPQRRSVEFHAETVYLRNKLPATRKQ
jgi:hypothetical protein